MDVALYSFLAILLSICISFLPKKALKPITSAFSFGKNGLRKMRRRRDTTDTIANVCLGIALRFCVFWHGQTRLRQKWTECIACWCYSMCP